MGVQGSGPCRAAEAKSREKSQGACPGFLGLSGPAVRGVVRLGPGAAGRGPVSACLPRTERQAGPGRPGLRSCTGRCPERCLLSQFPP